VPIAIAVDRQRVHRVHPIAAGGQGLDEQAPIGLDPDRHHRLDLVVSVGERATNEIVQPGDPGQIVGDLPGCDDPALDVHHADVMGLLGPVHPHEHFHRRNLPDAAGRTRARNPGRLTNGSGARSGTSSHLP